MVSHLPRVALRARGLSEMHSARLAELLREAGWQITDDNADIAIVDVVSEEQFDALTGLASAAALRRGIVAHLSQPEEPLSGILLGVRRFGAVNATFGEAVGDAVLSEVARRIEDYAADHALDTLEIGRFGGGSFLVLATGPVQKAIWTSLAADLLESITQPINIDEHVIRLTGRAGLATSLAGEDAPSFLNRLGMALDIAAKRAGQRIKWADRSADAVPGQGPTLEIDLLKALERDEIQMSFQPQFDVASGAIVGAEALARWDHEEFGQIGAQTLFSVAERTDFIEPLSAHIAKKALTLAAGWPEALGHIRLALNVTANELASRQFLDKMLAVIAETGFPADRLTLEITESALIDRLDDASAMLQKAREAGLRTAIDDFGTGYSNFLYLKSLPLDYLKLDHGMTREIEGTARDRIILRSMIALAKALELQVIAEGVESEAQLAFLAEDGCDFYQGFLKAGPLVNDAFVAFVMANASHSAPA